MRNRVAASAVVVRKVRIFLLAACCAAFVHAADDPKEIVSRALQRNAHNDEVSRQYTYLQRNEVRALDGAGHVKHRDLETFDITLLEGSPYQRLVARDDKPLSPQEEKKQQEKLKQNIEQRRKETAAQRQQRIADWDRKRRQESENRKEVADAFDFHLAGDEQLGGIPVWVLDGTPHPGYKPKSKEAAYFPKIKGRIWVAKSDYTPIKISIETLDTISIGAFLFRVAKGGRIAIEWAHVNDEVWLPKQVSFTASARLLLVKGYHIDADFTFSNYKKFSAESRIVDVQ